MANEKPVERACTTCVFCLREDYGYSNWTTEGSYLHCLRGLNPALDGQEEPWRDPTPELAAALDVALTCPSYREGVPAQLDVDLESMEKHKYGDPYTPENVKHYAEDAEVAALLAAWLNR